MIKFRLIAVGKLKEKYWTDAVNEYVKRISRFGELSIIELPERRTLEEEGKEILQKVKGYLVVTDVGGELVSSEDIAKITDKAMSSGFGEISVVIGSSEGLSDEVKNAANKRISFGRVTYPHQFMRVIVCEQVYRALTILNGVTYHK